MLMMMMCVVNNYFPPLPRPGSSASGLDCWLGLRLTLGWTVVSPDDGGHQEGQSKSAAAAAMGEEFFDSDLQVIPNP